MLLRRHPGVRIRRDSAPTPPLIKLIGRALVGAIMILMIGKGVTSGVATSTKISSFAVIYAIVVGWLAFRELTWRSLYKLLVDSAMLSGMSMFIVAAAGGVPTRSPSSRFRTHSPT